jgi:dTMP kinase
MYLSGEFGKDPNSISPYITSTFYAVDRYASYKQDYEEFYNSGKLSEEEWEIVKDWFNECL